VTRRTTEKKEKEGQLERHKWWQTEKAVYTHIYTNRMISRETEDTWEGALTSLWAMSKIHHIADKQA